MDDVLSELNLDHGRNGYDRAVFDFSACRYFAPSSAVAILAFRDYLNERGVKTVALLPRYGLAGKFMVALGMMPKEGKIEDAYVEARSRQAVGLKRCLNTKECAAAELEIARHVEQKLNPDKGTLASIAYMIGEIWDNAGCHGYGCYEVEEYPKPVYIAAYSYRNRIEVAILDRGVGIHHTLRRNNPAFKNSTAKEAILRSLDETVSGHPKNSAGFGLYATSQFVKENRGELYIWTSNRRLHMHGGQQWISRCAYEQGTLVTFIIHAQQPIPFDRIVTSQDTDEYLDIVIRENTTGP